MSNRFAYVVSDTAQLAVFYKHGLNSGLEATVFSDVAFSRTQ